MVRLIGKDDTHNSHTWSLNRSLLLNSKYKEQFIQQLQLYFAENASPETSSFVLWEAMKAVM